MRRSFVAVVAGLAILFSVGCGGAGDRQGNLLLGDRSVLVQQSGGTLSLSGFGASVRFAPGAVGRGTPVSLQVFDDQFQDVVRPGRRYTKHGITLTMNPAAVADAADIQITAPFAGPYDRVGTMLAARSPRGVVIALPSSQTGPHSVTGRLSRRTLEALSFGLGPQVPVTLQIFTANRVAPLAGSPPFGGFLSFSDGQWGGVPPDLTGQRVAFLVHGLESSLQDLVPLAAELAALRLPGQTQPHYGAVVGFQYTSNAPIAQLGRMLADLCGPSLGQAAQVDVVAHSMGNLVARYAMETPSLPGWFGPNVRNYIALGGPMVGVPLGELSTLQSFLFLFPIEAEPCLLDMLTDGVNGTPETPFLTDLNLTPGQRGPNYDTLRAFTLSGSDWEAEEPPLGDAVHLLYLFVVGLEDVDDGLVASYSAQSPVMSRQSRFWSPGPTLDVSHAGLHSDPRALAQISAWIRAGH